VLWGVSRVRDPPTILTRYKRCLGIRETLHDITPEKHLQENYTSVMNVTGLRVY
jgi:hypothetical protein